MRRLFALLSFLVLAPALAHAQLRTVVGPERVPLGGQLSVTFSNDTNLFQGTSASWLVVRNANGQIVYSDTNFEISVTTGPYGSTTFYWNLVDGQGQPLPPGRYTAETKVDFGAPSSFHDFRIGGAAGLVLEGTANINGPFPGTPSQRNFYLQAPSAPGALYFLLAAATDTVGIATCAGTLPLDFDALLLQSLAPDGVFASSVGTLNGLGRSKAPTFPLPPVASLVGIQLEAAFIVLDPLQPCAITHISNAHSLEIFD